MPVISLLHLYLYMYCVCFCFCFTLPYGKRILYYSSPVIVVKDMWGQLIIVTLELILRQNIEKKKQSDNKYKLEQEKMFRSGIRRHNLRLFIKGLFKYKLNISNIDWKLRRKIQFAKKKEKY